MSHARPFAAALVALALTIGATGPPTGAQAPSTDGGPQPLAEAVTFAAPDTRTIRFTDWAALKAAHGLEAITSSSPMPDRLSALLELGAQEAPFTAFALDRFEGWADAWGWDTTDLAWEAELAGPGAPVRVLRLRDGFDLAPVAGWYDVRGFDRRLHGDAVIRSHGIDPRLDWQATMDPAVLNTAFLDDGRTLLLSTDREALVAALDARSIVHVRAPPAAVVAAHLGRPLSGAIELGPDACRAWDPRNDGADPGPNGRLLDAIGVLRAPEAMGVGLQRDGERVPGPSARFVFGYPDPGRASADLPGRMLLADQGWSTRTGRPLGGSVLRLLRFDLVGPLLVLDVAPIDDLPRRIRDAYDARDLVFVMCD